MMVIHCKMCSSYDIHPLKEDVKYLVCDNCGYKFIPLNELNMKDCNPKIDLGYILTNKEEN